MATKTQIAKIVQLRGLGFSLEEIAVEVGLSKSAVAYQLQKLKDASKKSKADEVFNAAILGGLVGAASGLAIAALIDIINKRE
jgi:orotate phosphoribosyltransferase-like protein